MSSRYGFNDGNKNFRQGANLTNLRKEIAHLTKLFEDAGAVELDLPSLLDSNILIDLYGEDIRNRTYTTTDSFGTKKILRPDFTVPIVQMHIATQSRNGKYSYAGPVWRSQPYGVTDPAESYQVGFEYFHEIEASKADAEVFNLFLECTKGLEINVEIGDMAIIRAVVNCLDISENKKRLLLRHLWRPDRFTQLIHQLSSGNSFSEPRKTLFQAIRNDKIRGYIEANGPVIGKRSIDEIVIRSNELLTEESNKPIPKTVVTLIEKIQALSCKLSNAPKELSEFPSLGHELTDVRDKLSKRIQAMTELGIDVSKLNFVTNLTRTSLEYYDGFIFTISTNGLPDAPPLVQGGRYDALTNILGKGANIPAVGGIVRPELLASCREET